MKKPLVLRSFISFAYLLASSSATLLYLAFCLSSIEFHIKASALLVSHNESFGFSFINYSRRAIVKAKYDVVAFFGIVDSTTFLASGSFTGLAATLFSLDEAAFFTGAAGFLPFGATFLTGPDFDLTTTFAATGLDLVFLIGLDTVLTSGFLTEVFFVLATFLMATLDFDICIFESFLGEF